MKVTQRVSELETQTVGSTLGWSQFTKGHNSVKTVELWYLISAHQLSCFIFVPSFKKISQRVSELLRGCGLYTEIFKGA